MKFPLEKISKYNVKLASHSPRRRELLAMLDIKFEIPEILDVQETVPADMSNNEVPLYLARLKADAYKEQIGENDLYITADTVVILGDKILGKPKDAEDARKMLRALSGKVQKVITGVCVFTKHRMETFKVVSKVHFAHLSREEINYYVETYNPLDKAGAYGIQEWIGAAAIKSIEGSYYNVMGLPLHRVYRALLKF